MFREAQAIFSLLLMATCAATGLAHMPPTPPPSPAVPSIPGLLPPGIPSLLPPGIPGLFPLPGTPDEIAKCWSSLQNVPGCVWEIFTSIFSGKFAVGPACCKAFVAVDENCLLKMFPLFPSFPPLIKSKCGQVNIAAAAATPVGSKQ